MFSQLQAIVHGPPPELPTAGISDECRDFISQCVRKDPAERPSYADLLAHPFILFYENHNVDMPGWARRALEWSHKNRRRQASG